MPGISDMVSSTGGKNVDPSASSQRAAANQDQQEEGEASKVLCSMEEKPCLLEQEPRFYQETLHKIALNENTIVFLGTGLGKTLIPVLYLRSPQVQEEIKRGRKLVFLAPSRDLLKQQAEYTKEKVNYRVKVYCGGKMDHGNGDSWRKEMAEVDVLFMMADIFVFAISTNLLDWREFVALVLDECHHAYNSKDKGLASGDGSAYRSILLHYRDYYADKPQDERLYPRPRLMGLTASLINSMPKDNDSVEDMVEQLERLFHGKCVTDLRVHESRPTVVTYGYTPFVYTVANDSLTKILFDLREQIVCALNKVAGVGQARKSNKNDNIQTRNARPNGGAELGMSTKLENFPKIMDHLIMVREKCGIWALEAICAKLYRTLEDQSKLDYDCGLDQRVRGIHAGFTEIIRTIRESLHSLLGPMDMEDSLLAYSSAKPMCLLDILSQFYEKSHLEASKKSPFSCVVFVRSRLEVVAVHSWLSDVSRLLPKYKFIKCGFALGLAAGATTKCTISRRKASDQARMLDDLRAGTLNVVVTTAVLEEGIDLPDCSIVIRYDLPHNFREYVQSRGRARQQVSTFVAMCEESERTKVEGKLRNLDNLEQDLKLFIGGRRRPKSLEKKVTGECSDNKLGSLEEVDIYYARNNAVRIGPKVASQILNRYCQSSKERSSGFKYITSQPRPGVFRTIIMMPASGCPLRDPIEGGPKTTKDNAVNSAGIAVLKALIGAKELNDNGTTCSVIAMKNLEQSLTFSLRPPLVDRTSLYTIKSGPGSETQGGARPVNGQQRADTYTGSEQSSICHRGLQFQRESSKFYKHLVLDRSAHIMGALKLLHTRVKQIKL